MMINQKKNINKGIFPIIISMNEFFSIVFPEFILRNENFITNNIEMISILTLINNHLNKIIVNRLTILARNTGLFNTITNETFIFRTNKEYLPSDLLSKRQSNYEDSGYNKFMIRKIVSNFLENVLPKEVTNMILELIFCINDINNNVVERLSKFIGYEHVVYIRYLSAKNLHIVNDTNMLPFIYNDFSNFMECSICKQNDCINNDSGWFDNETYLHYPLYCKFGCTIKCKCGCINENVYVDFFLTSDDYTDEFYAAYFYIFCKKCSSELSYNKAKYIDFAL